MIEAVSTLSVQSFSPRSAPQAAASYSGAPVSSSAKDFISSRIRVDNLLNRAILEYRSSEGEVVRQYPTQSQIQAFKQAQAAVESHHEALASGGGGEQGFTSTPSQGESDGVQSSPQMVSSVGGEGASPAPSAAPSPQGGQSILV